MKNVQSVIHNHQKVFFDIQLKEEESYVFESPWIEKLACQQDDKKSNFKVGQSQSCVNLKNNV